MPQEKIPGLIKYNLFLYDWLKIHMFDSAKAVIFPSKGISLFVEGLNPGHCVYGMHPTFCHRSQLQRDGETREQRHF